MINQDIRDLVSENGLKYKDIAEEMEISREWISRLMRFPLSQANKNRIMVAINELLQKGNDDTENDFEITNSKQRKVKTNPRYKRNQAAYIQMAYRKKYFCTLDWHLHTGQCHTIVAEDLSCRYYESDKLGKCKHAEIQIEYKAVLAQEYETEYIHDGYNPWLSCMEVTIGENTYQCEHVSIDRKTIYPIFATIRGKHE